MKKSLFRIEKKLSKKFLSQQKNYLYLRRKNLRKK